MRVRKKLLLKGMIEVRKIKMADPHFTEDDRAWIYKEIDLILSFSLSMGPNVKLFEEEFATMVGVKHAIAMNSCTAALEVALAFQGIDGGEVIVPAETFIATGMAVHLVGGTPVFAEVLESTFCLDLEHVRRLVNDNTRGIVLVHFGGMITPDIDDFVKFCNERELFLIEDAAHAPGAMLDGNAAGSFGSAGCFSFYPTKVITAGEGGMLTTNDDKLAMYARSQQHRGRDMDASTEQYLFPGRNIRMTEIAALLGRVQLSHLDEFLEQRQKLAGVYQDEFQGDKRVTIVLPADKKMSSCWKVPVVLDENIHLNSLEAKMKDAGIFIDRAYQPAIHLQPVFRKLYGTKAGQLPTTEAVLARHICLPCHPQMKIEDAVYVAQTLKNILDSEVAINDC
jgi:perosamine synthetase